MTGKTPGPDNSLSSGGRSFSLLLISLLAIFGYFNVLASPFTMDDNHLVVENTFIRDITQLKEIVSCAPDRPFLMFTYALNYRLGGLHSFGYHLGNILIHTFAAVTLFSVLLYLQAYFLPPYPARALLLPLTTACLFSLEPVFIEAVTYVAGRSSSLSALLFLLSLLFFLKICGHHGPGGRVMKRIFFLLSLLCYCLALATKEIAATLPLVLTLFCLLAAFSRKRKLRLLRLTPPFYAVLALLFFIRWSRTGVLLEKAPGFLTSHTRLDYLCTQFHVVPLYYVNKLLLPIGLNIDIDFPVIGKIFSPRGFGALAVLLALCIFCLRKGRKTPLLIFSLAWFAVTLLPTSSLVPIVDVAAERRLYLPGMGFVLLMAFITLRFRPGGKRILPLLSLPLVILVLMATDTIARNALFADEFILWKDVLQKSPHKARSHYAMGYLHENRHEVDPSILEYRKALELDPRYADAWYGLGLAYYRKGIWAKSASAYEMPVRLMHAYLEYHRGERPGGCRPCHAARFDVMAKYFTGYGTALQKMNKFAPADEAYRNAMRIDPEFLPARFNRGTLLIREKAYGEAQKVFQEILIQDPAFRPALQNLAGLYLLTGKEASAREVLARGLSLYPHDPRLQKLRAQIRPRQLAH